MLIQCYELDPLPFVCLIIRDRVLREDQAVCFKLFNRLSREPMTSDHLLDIKCEYGIAPIVLFQPQSISIVLPFSYWPFSYWQNLVLLVIEMK